VLAELLLLYHKDKVAIRYPTARDLNGGVNYSTRSKQEPKKDLDTRFKEAYDRGAASGWSGFKESQEPEPLSPRELRRKLYWKLLHGESRLQYKDVGDAGKAIGALQIWPSFFEDTWKHAADKGRSYPRMKYEDLRKGLHAGASAFAENQRRNNPRGWETGDERSILLAHHWGAEWEGKAAADPEEEARYLRDMEERFPKEKREDKYWRLPKHLPGSPSETVWEKTDDGGRLIEASSKRRVVDYWEYLTTEALYPEEAKRMTFRHRPESSLWSWPEQQNG